ncbi:hypothetical protein N7455_011070 [Penicillium solitum]|uniref:uncharacterized protein n=1 Tax=Penicillium solitum TaxID=60172 RepID=UPI0032C43B27|nr:hypothetical protein N7536_007857 [Penicillium majusculum]KAJ5851214.1 hypothetical protein N7455_011070 [Penicillium solitum]
MFAHEDKKLATQDLDTPEPGPCETFRFTAHDLARNHLHSGDSPLRLGTPEFRTLSLRTHADNCSPPHAKVVHALLMLYDSILGMREKAKCECMNCSDRGKVEEEEEEETKGSNDSLATR